MKNKYSFLVRLFIGLPILFITFIFWCIIFLCSDRDLGKVLKETGDNLLKE